MKNESLQKIKITNKSENLNKEITNKDIIKNKDNYNRNKINIPKLKTNFINSNENKEIEHLWKRTTIDVNHYKKKQKLILNIKDNNSKNNNYIKIKRQKAKREEEHSCNTDRTKNKINKRNKTLYNFFISSNLNIHKKNETINTLLLSPKNKLTKNIFDKSKNKDYYSEIEKIEKTSIDKTINNSKLSKLSKFKSSQNFKNGKIFTKIKSPIRDKYKYKDKDVIFSENNSISNNKSKNRKRTLDKDKDKDKTTDNFENMYTLDNNSFSKNSSSSFYMKNVNLTLPSFTFSKNLLKNEELKDLDIIFEGNKNTISDSHHYLENTISRKNKMIKKRKTDILPNKYIENKKINNNKLINKKINITTDKEYQQDKLYINTKILKSKHSNYLNLNNIKKKTKSIDHTNYNSNIDKNKIFNGKLDNYLITKELGKGSCAIVKLATHK